MAEQLTRLKAKAFRGIPRELDIELPGGSSLVALGPNGSGKSSIADAIEFFFTGSVATLAREGRRIIHHVGRDPAETEVVIETSGSLGGSATEHTFVENARLVARRETFLLRGPTLAGFIDKAKHDKWQHLLDLLGLGSLERFREDLQYVVHNLAGRATHAQLNLDRRQADLSTSLPEPSLERLLAALQEKGSVAGVKAPAQLEDLMGDEWIKQIAGGQEHVRRAARLEQLLRDTGQLRPFPAIALLKSWNLALDAGKIDDRARRRMVEAADVAFSIDPQNRCPLCGQSIEPAAFRELLRSLLDSFKADSTSLQKPRESALRYLDQFNAAFLRRDDIKKRAKVEGVELPELPESPFASARQRIMDELPVELERFVGVTKAFRDWDEAAKMNLSREILPNDPKDAELVRFISLAQQGRSWILAKQAYAAAEAVAHRAEQVFLAYQAAQHQYIEDVLALVSDRVAKIFERLHHQDELSSLSVETVGEKGIELAVDFHGTKRRPPHGVLSESRLNALGLALFLGMADVFNQELRFLCLDDVVNSFDAEHRADLAAVLVEEFADWQVILLTHDPLLFDRIRRLAPKWQTLEFTSWSYDEGPRRTGYEVAGTLNRAKEHLDRGEGTPAATLGRRALEELLQEACEGLASPVSFRRGMKNDHREIGELLNGIRRSLKALQLLSPDMKTLLGEVMADLQTVLNIEAHASSGWASPSEVSAALDRIDTLDKAWVCKSCESRPWARGNDEIFRCKCGDVVWPPPT